MAGSDPGRLRHRTPPVRVFRPSGRKATTRRRSEGETILLLATIAAGLAAPLLAWVLPGWLGPVPAPFTFAVAAIAVALLADWLRRGTEQLALHAGPAVGGLLAVSLGSAAELILALLVLIRGHADVVQAQITGSIIGTALLGLGLAALVGGLTRERQRFDRGNAGLLSSLLLLSVIALTLPAVVDFASRAGPAPARAAADEHLSLAVAVVLLLLYAGNLVFTLVARRDALGGGGKEQEQPRWSVARCLAVMIAATVAVALESEVLSGALEATGHALALSPIFLGVIVLALAGTSSDLIAAIAFAREDRMDLVMSLCIGSSIQVALVLAPLLTLISWLIGKPMNLVFGRPLDLFAVIATVFIVNAVARDGESNWFEGMLLVGVYVLLAAGFFLVSPA